MRDDRQPQRREDPCDPVDRAGRRDAGGSEHFYSEEIVTTPFQLDADGMLPIPTAPGLGIALDPAGIVKYSRGGQR